jgi:hypothetical protein
MEFRATCAELELLAGDASVAAVRARAAVAKEGRSLWSEARGMAEGLLTAVAGQSLAVRRLPGAREAAYRFRCVLYGVVFSAVHTRC